MIVKISEHYYINTDYLVDIDYEDTQDTGEVDIHLAHSGVETRRTVSVVAADYLLALLDANDALIDPNRFEQELILHPPSLQTRVAQALRYDFPQGATFSVLATHLDVDKSSIRYELVELECGNVITTLPSAPGDPSTIWIHKNNHTAQIEQTKALCDYCSRGVGFASHDPVSGAMVESPTHFWTDTRGNEQTAPCAAQHNKLAPGVEIDNTIDW